MKKFKMRLSYRKLAPIFISCIFLGNFASAYTIPAERVINWEGNIGVKGEIPNRTTEIDCTQAPYNVPTDGASDASQAIEDCFNGIAVGEVAYLPEGVYVIESSVILNSDGKTLRGAGSNKTLLDCNINTANNENGCITISGKGVWNPEPNIIWEAGFSKGTTMVTLSSTYNSLLGNLEVGDMLMLDLVDDNSYLVWDCGVSCSLSLPTQGTRDNSTRHLMQIVEVIGINGNQVYIDPPLYYDYNSNQSPSAFWPTKTTSNIGIENLKIDCKDQVGTKYNIGISYAKNIWVKNIESYSGVRAHVKPYYSMNVEIRDSFFHHSQAYESVSYGVEPKFASALLVENNIFDTLVSAFTAGPITGSVVAYNYFTNLKYDKVIGWQTPGLGLHAAHIMFTLFEGNNVPSIYTDNYWGSSSHTTIFRNRIYGGQSNLTMNTFAIISGEHSLYNSYIGNILGINNYHTNYEFKGPVNCSELTGIYSTGYRGNCKDANLSYFDPNVFTTMLRHMNWNYATDSIKNCGDSGEPGCQSGPADTTLPDSLYLSFKPSWFGSVKWPPIDPNIFGEYDIPAKLRYEGIENPSDLTPPANPSGLSVK